MLHYAQSADGTHIFHQSNTGKYLYVNGPGAEGISTSDSLAPAYAKLGLLDSHTAVSALIGIIHLKTGSYVVIADSHLVTGRALDSDIAKVTSWKIVPTSKSPNASSEEQVYLKLLDLHLSLATLYFSLGNYDLTLSLQKQKLDAHSGPDARFWWNMYLSSPLLGLPEAASFATPMIYGYFKSVSASRVFGTLRSFLLALLTRRSVVRAGTRYFRRGLDEHGNAANFNETEQILTTDSGQVYAYLQTRGLVPVLWLEINTLKYKPNLKISSKLLLNATGAHFEQQVESYGNVVCVNLVNQKGYEMPVKQAFERAIANLSPQLAKHVSYIYFDFHHECSKMRWDRIALLLEDLQQKGVSLQDYFHADSTSDHVYSSQSTAVRTNCMDCLDRTNVVQLMIARWVLLRQLEDLGYISPSNGDWAAANPEFNLQFRGMWADNADAVSNAYSGTGALKTDFTRTGMRTKQGALNDLINSISRYYKNTFTDGMRQDSFDLFLGKAKPSQDFISDPFVDKRPVHIQLLPYTMGTSLVIFFAVLLYPRGRIFEWKNLVVLLGCLAYTARSAYYMYRHGSQFVAWPKLVPVDFLVSQDVLDADGKLSGVTYVESPDYLDSSKKRL